MMTGCYIYAGLISYIGIVIYQISVHFLAKIYHFKVHKRVWYIYI